MARIEAIRNLIYFVVVLCVKTILVESYSWDRLNQSTLTLDPVNSIRVSPFYGTCGNQTIVKKDNTSFTCKSACPSNVTYVEKQLTMINTTIVENMSFWKIGCRKKFTELLKPTCFESDKIIDYYDRETHTMWIKPLLNGTKGTVLALSSSRLHQRIQVDLHQGSLIFKHNFSYPYPNSNIQDNVWTHLALQISSQKSSVSIFVNGELLPPAHALSHDIGVTSGSSLSVGVPNMISGEGLYGNFEPLDIQQCIDIGYSSSVLVNCTRDVNMNCTQGAIEAVYFNQDSPKSIYNCNPLDINRETLTIFACSWFLSPNSYETEQLLPCRSLCEEILQNCGSLVGIIPGFNSTTCQSLSNDNTCVSKGYIPDYGLYKGDIQNYKIWDGILTNREIAAFAKSRNVPLSLDVLPLVEGYNQCLCPPDYPAIDPSNDLFCVDNIAISSPQVSQPFSVPRLGPGYNIEQYAGDQDNTTSWISTPGLETVNLDFVFEETIQVLGIKIFLDTVPPQSPNNLNITTLEMYILKRVGDTSTWRKVAVFANYASHPSYCRDYINVTQPYHVGCYMYNITSSTDKYLVTADLLEGREQWYNSSYMDTTLFHFLSGDGIRILFGAFPYGASNNQMYQYHSVNEVDIIARHFGGEILCGCYAPGTDSLKTCNVMTGQCPCLPTIGDQTKSGKKCKPYAERILPNYGPVSGGTVFEIFGGYFGDEPPAIELHIPGYITILAHVLASNQTYINAVTSSINSTVYPGVLNQPADVLIRLHSGYLLETGLVFTYKEDPIISAIYPLQSFIRGGIVQTVVGSYIDSVYKPIMLLTYIIFYPNPGREIASSTCTVENSTVMFCPTPDITSFSHPVRKKRQLTDVEIDDIIDKDDIEISLVKLRQRRQTQLVNYLNNPDKYQYYIGFKLDGLQEYINVTANEALGADNGIIYIYVNPDIIAWSPETMIFKPYKGDTFITIAGTRMDSGCSLPDYRVEIGGDGICENNDLSSNQYICSPPPDPPNFGLYTKGGNHRVFLTVGAIRFQIGYLDYWTGPLDDPSVVAAIVVVCLIIAIVLIGLGIYFGLWKYLKQNPYRYLKMKKQSKRANVYSLPEKDLMDQLKETEPVLYQDVLKSQIDASRMLLGLRIGKGNFGEVHEGTYSAPNGQQKVAIKMLKSGDDRKMKDIIEFLQEATIMKDFIHENVLTLHGVVLIQNNPHVILPLMELGDLRDYVASPRNHFKVGDLLNYGYQVSKGMAYLASQKFVHRDLAARNCMINKEHCVKIADFGLARDIYERDYYAVADRSRPLPVKWMAVECLDNFKFSTKSDVWSFGVTLWELLMRGAKPYAHIDNIDMKRYIKQGNRLEKPSFCPDIIFDIMKDCWKHTPDERPEFSEIAHRFENFFDEATKFEDNPSYEGRIHNGNSQSSPCVVSGDHEYLEMKTTDYNSYLALSTDVPTEVPPSGEAMNNNSNGSSYLDKFAVAPKPPSTVRYTLDPTTPTSPLEANDGYMAPVVVNNQDSLEMKQGGYTGLQKKNEGSVTPESPGYLQPVAMLISDEHA